MSETRNKNFVLAAMVFAVAMTFIDQTIVAIAIPILQRNLGISTTGSQWIINGYLLALAALFAFGGKLGDMLGRRRMVVIGVIGVRDRVGLLRVHAEGRRSRRPGSSRSACCRARPRR